MLEAEGIPVGTVVAKVGDSHPGVVDAVDLIAGGKVQLVVNTPRGRGPRADGLHIRSAALAHLVPCLTTVAAARAAAAGIADWVSHPLSVRSLQEYHQWSDEPGREPAPVRSPGTGSGARVGRAWRAVTAGDVDLSVRVGSLELPIRS